MRSRREGRALALGGELNLIVELTHPMHEPRRGRGQIECPTQDTNERMSLTIHVLLQGAHRGGWMSITLSQDRELERTLSASQLARLALPSARERTTLRLTIPQSPTFNFDHRLGCMIITVLHGSTLD